MPKGYWPQRIERLIPPRSPRFMISFVERHPYVIYDAARFEIARCSNLACAALLAEAREGSYVVDESGPRKVYSGLVLIELIREIRAAEPVKPPRTQRVTGGVRGSDQCPRADVPRADVPRATGSSTPISSPIAPPIGVRNG